MTTAIELEGAANSCEFLRDYDRHENVWSLPKVDGLWAAADVARALGRTGSGRVVALADSACDLSIPRLAEAVRVSKLYFEGASQSMCHGTVVALLITEVAPDVEVHAYEVVADGMPQRRALGDAIHAIAASPASVVNFSLGDALLPDDSTIQHGGTPPAAFGFGSQAPECPSGICTEVERMVEARTGRIVVAAAGNTAGGVFCPARSPAVLSCGFQSVYRRSIRVADGGWKEIAEGGPPNYPQSSGVAFVLRQPPEAVGSSFAAPLLAGAVALMDNPKEFGAFMTARYLAELGQGNIRSEIVDDEQAVSDVKRAVAVLAQAIEALPHRHHIENRTPTPCYECSAFAEPIYVDLGRQCLFLGQVEVAERWLRLVARLCPWSADANANLGAVLIYRANGNRDLLLEARDLYKKALTTRPESQTFRETIRAIDASLG